MSAASPAGVVPALTDRGLAWLSHHQVEILTQLDEMVLDWAVAAGARKAMLPALLPVADLAALDVYRNFPHLAMVATTLRVHGEPGEPGETTVRDTADSVPAEALGDAELALPSTVCYGVYVGHKNTRLDGDKLVTALGTCFRNETRYEGLRRLAAFRMREVVALGTPEHVRAHLLRFSDLTLAFAKEAGLSVERKAASDPFFDSFAEVFDPQPFHLDDTLARGHLFDGLAASGWHTAALFQRMFVDHLVSDAAIEGSPGVDKLRWIRPVRPGDVLSARVTVKDVGPSLSGPRYGTLRMLCEVLDADAKAVLTMTLHVIVRAGEPAMADGGPL
ncbi:MaoC/PaaZ C-terminal domain-containing protein [Actinokineospora sp.]|uniref:MaoC/PaaZ C-terminal domain-containing protein n=1 Tax=Actinokineospora sp. TaxID=1872133 RepID=UPI003D6A9256